MCQAIIYLQVILIYSTNLSRLGLTFYQKVNKYVILACHIIALKTKINNLLLFV